MIVYSLLLFMIAGGAYCISQKAMMGNLKWSTVSTGFWGTQSWMNKYKIENEFPIPAKNNWYTKLFVIKYKEKYPLSGSLLVFASDSYHFFQMIALMAFSASAAVLTHHPWIYLVAFRVTIGITFTVFYKLLAK